MSDHSNQQTALANLIQRFKGREIWIIGDDESIHDQHAGVFGICDGIEDGFLLLRLEGFDEPTVFYNLRFVRSVELAAVQSPGDARRFTLLRLDKREASQADDEPDSDGD